MTNKIDEAGYKFIESWEDKKLSAYLCQAGKPTIGTGNTHYADGTLVKLGDTLPDVQAAKALFFACIGEYETLVNNAIKVPLTQNEFNALVSLCWNIQLPFVGGTSGLVRMINAGQKIHAHEEFAKWNKATVNGVMVDLEGLAKRRFDEGAYFRGWKARVIR